MQYPLTLGLHRPSHVDCVHPQITILTLGNSGVLSICGVMTPASPNQHGGDHCGGEETYDVVKLEDGPMHGIDWRREEVVRYVQFICLRLRWNCAARLHTTEQLRVLPS